MALNVLIVDDCEVVRTLIAKALTLSKLPIGHMHQAGNGQEALAVLEDQWVDLILTDLNMPHMDGLEMIDQLHRDGVLKTIPVVVVSTEGSVTRMGELTQKGIAAYLRKPITPEALRDVVVEILGTPAEEDHTSALGDAFCEVVEGFAMMVGDMEDGTEDATDRWVQARLSFHGPVSGALGVAAPKSLVREIAANVLGLEVDDPEAAKAAPDALKEFANLVCGRVVGFLKGDTAVFDLSPPVFGEYSEADWCEAAGRTVARFSVEGEPIRIGLDVRTWEA